MPVRSTRAQFDENYQHIVLRIKEAYNDISWRGQLGGNWRPC